MPTGDSRRQPTLAPAVAFMEKGLYFSNCEKKSMFTFHCAPFSQVSTTTLYQLLQLRQEVFIVEQRCCYLDCDGKDLLAHMVWCTDADGLPVAHTRLLPQGVSYPAYASIGRVAASAAVRGQGLGYALMVYSIEQLFALWGAQDIKIGAQAYLQEFYQSLGFEDLQRPYLEDGIPHLEMLRPQAAGLPVARLRS